MDPCGKGVFLTGGARGIGRGLMEALLQKGAKVLFCDILTDVGKATEKELQEKFGADNVSFRQCDVSDAEQLKTAFEVAVSKFGAVDICVNNAGFVDESRLEEMIAVNTMGQIRGSLLALEHMRRDKDGRGGLIVNTVSSAGVLPVHFFPGYCASKHAMIGFTTSWAKNPKMAEMGVKWKALCPDGVHTDFLNIGEDQIIDHAGFQAVLQQVWSDKMLVVSDVVKGFLRMVTEESDDVIFHVEKATGGAYRKRQLLYSDGASNPVTVD